MSTDNKEKPINRATGNQTNSTKQKVVRTPEESAADNEKLTPEQQAELEEKIQVNIRKSDSARCVVAANLLKIHDCGNFDEYSSFEAYCEEKFDFKKAHAYRLLLLARIRRHFRKNPPVVGGDGEPILPQNENQVRSIPGDEEPKIWARIWKKAVSLADGDRVTGRIVEDAVRVICPKDDQEESHTPAKAAPKARGSEVSKSAPDDIDDLD